MIVGHVVQKFGCLKGLEFCMCGVVAVSKIAYGNTVGSVMANNTLHWDQLKVLGLIGDCRTAVLGSDKEGCISCSYQSTL